MENNNSGIMNNGNSSENNMNGISNDNLVNNNTNLNNYTSNNLNNGLDMVNNNQNINNNGTNNVLNNINSNLNPNMDSALQNNSNNNDNSNMYNNSNGVGNNSSISNYQQDADFMSLDSTKKTNKKGIVKLILSILNIVVFFPIAYNFSILYILFGGLSGQKINYLLIIVSSVYMLASIIFLLKSIWNMIKHKNILKIVFVGAILLIILLNVISYFDTRKSLNDARKKLNSSAEIISNPAYMSDDVELAVKNVYFYENYVYVKFYLNNKSSDKYYNFRINKVKVNGIQVAFENDVSSHFSKVSSWVKPLNNSNAYGIRIRNNELEKNGINKNSITNISYNFDIYFSKTNSENYDDFVSYDNYYYIVVKK